MDMLIAEIHSDYIRRKLIANDKDTTPLDEAFAIVRAYEGSEDKWMKPTTPDTHSL